LLATDNAMGAVFIQWTHTGGVISGTVQADAVTGTAPSEEVSSNHYAVTGKITNGQVTLSLEGAIQVFGTYSAGVLRLNMPDQDGTLRADTFTPASAAAFNTVVQKLQSRVYDDNQAALVQQQIQEQIQRQQAAIDRAAKQVTDDISALNQTDLSGDVGNISGNAKSVQDNLQSAQTNMHDVVTATSGYVCAAANYVAAAAQYASAAFSPIPDQVKRLGSDMGAVKQMMQTGQKDLTAYQQAQAQLPSYTPATPVGDLTSAIRTAQAAINTAASQANQAIDQANSAVAQAYQLANQASQQNGCGPLTIQPQPTPVPLFHP
jgi:hypothetical protein